MEVLDIIVEVNTTAWIAKKGLHITFFFCDLLYLNFEFIYTNYNY